MVQDFSVAKGVREGCQVVVVRGELDELTALVLDDALAECRAGWPLIVDLSEVEFMSSAGLHALLRQRPIRLSIVAPPGNTARLFQIVTANSRCPLFQDPDSAVSVATPLAVVSGSAVSTPRPAHGGRSSITDFSRTAPAGDSSGSGEASIVACRLNLGEPQ